VYLYALQAFQKPIKCPSHFSKAAREFQYILQPIGKKSSHKNPQKDLAKVKKEPKKIKLSQVLKTQMKLKSYLRSLLKNFKKE